MKVVCILCILAVGIGSKTALAEECSQVLKWGVWESLDKRDSVYASKAFANRVCSQEQKSGEMGIPGTNITGKASASSSSCASSSSNFTLATDSQLRQVKAAEAIVTAWSNCMQNYNNRRATYGSIKFRDDLHDFTLEFRSTHADAISRRFKLAWNGELLCPKYSAQRLKQGITLESGSDSISCRRPDISQSMTIDVSYPKSEDEAQTFYLGGARSEPTGHVVDYDIPIVASGYSAKRGETYQGKSLGTSNGEIQPTFCFTPSESDKEFQKGSHQFIPDYAATPGYDAKASTSFSFTMDEKDKVCIRLFASTNDCKCTIGIGGKLKLTEVPKEISRVSKRSGLRQK